MKRFMLLLILCLTLVNFSACSHEQSKPATTFHFSDANFNNNYWFSGDFWAFEDNIFYSQDGFYNMGVYWSAHGSNNKLFEESDFADDSIKHGVIGDIFVCDNYLYFEINTDQGDNLYRYDLKESAFAPVCEIPRLDRWVVVDNYFIYIEYLSNNDEKSTPLCVYNLMDGTTTQVCENVEEFGVVDGQVRYITHSDSYELYQYSFAENSSSLLGQFVCEFNDEYDVFNFTPDAVVMLNWGTDYDRNLVVYSLHSNSSAIYTLPKGIHDMVAYDRYAYLVVYDTYENTSAAISDEDNGIYRINLDDGSYEVIERDGNDDTDIHVISDDGIYVIQRRMNYFYQARRHVYFFDYATGDKEKLIVF